MGPLLGSLVAAAFYHVLEALNWKTANPGQDFDDLEAQSVDAKKPTLRPNIYAGAAIDAGEEKKTGSENGPDA